MFLTVIPARCYPSICKGTYLSEECTCFGNDRRQFNFLFLERSSNKLEQLCMRLHMSDFAYLVQFAIVLGVVPARAPVYRLIYPSLHLSACSPVNLLICPSLHLSARLPGNRLIFPSLHLSARSPENQLIYTSVLTSVCSPVNRLICPSVHTSTCSLAS